MSVNHKSENKNILSVHNPELALEWHPKKNGDLSADDVTYGSHKSVWWICSNGHEWQAIISNRARLGRSCPYCTHQQVLVGENDLATTHPAIAKDWHPQKNGTLTPADVSYGSNKTVWWLGECGHEWQSSIKTRKNGKNGCPYCSGKRVLSGENDFATVFPKYLSEWDFERNAVLPSEVTYGSGKKVWWRCKNGHEYSMAICNKVKGESCPACQRRRRTSFPEQAIFFYVRKVFPDAINSYTDIFDGSMELDIYIPSELIGIEYDGKVYHKNRDNIIRDARKYAICKENGIKLLRVREITQYNPVINCDYKIDIPNGSSRYLDSVVVQIMYILGKQINVNIERDRQSILAYLTKMDDSLVEAFPGIAKEWNYERNGSLIPNVFHPGSNEKVWWKCKDCGYEWRTAISERTGEDKTGCPKCAFKRGAEKHKKCEMIKKGSIAVTNPKLLELWDYERNLYLPKDYHAGSTEKVWWKCKNGHFWQADIPHQISKANECSYCSNKKVWGGYNDLLTRNPVLAREWDYALNTEVSPNSIMPGSGKRVYWKCSKCGHSWKAQVSSRNAGSGCPRCQILSRKTQIRNVDTNEIFDSVSSAAKKYSVTVASLSSCLKGRTRTSAGFHWEYVKKNTL